MLVFRGVEFTSEIESYPPYKLVGLEDDPFLLGAKGLFSERLLLVLGRVSFFGWGRTHPYRFTVFRHLESCLTPKLILAYFHRSSSAYNDNDNEQ